MIGSDDARWQSVFPLRAVGYGLLILAVFDIVNILYPADFTNAQWEFSVFGELVERVPVPLIGLALIFLGRAYGRNIWEKRFVMLLSWLSLIFGIGFFVLAPLGWNAFSRIDDQVKSAASQQVKQRTERAAQIERQIEGASFNQLEIFAGRLNQQGRTIVGDGGEEGLRKQILAELDTASRQA
ncbi:MAG: HpsJ family protein, partial [Cyanobacteria bacterium J06648_11]